MAASTMELTAAWDSLECAYQLTTMFRSPAPGCLGIEQGMNNSLVVNAPCDDNAVAFVFGLVWRRPLRAQARPPRSIRIPTCPGRLYDEDDLARGLAGSALFGGRSGPP